MVVSQLSSELVSCQLSDRDVGPSMSADVTYESEANGYVHTPRVPVNYMTSVGADAGEGYSLQLSPLGPLGAAHMRPGQLLSLRLASGPGQGKLVLGLFSSASSASCLRISTAFEGSCCFTNPQDPTMRHSHTLVLLLNACLIGPFATIPVGAVPPPRGAPAARSRLHL